MSEQTQPQKPDPSITLLDGCIGWPVSSGGLVRIDPFHIKAFGIQPAQNQAADTAVESHGWVVWVDVGSGAPFQVFYREKRKAMIDFVLVQNAKMRH